MGGELGEFVLAGQLQTNEIQGNDISLEVFGSNIESATSICVRVVNSITVERDDSLVGTCLESAVAQLEEPELAWAAAGSDGVCGTDIGGESACHHVPDYHHPA